MLGARTLRSHRPPTTATPRRHQLGQGRQSVVRPVMLLAGLVVAGIFAIIVGAALKSHFAFSAAVCNTYGGPVGDCTASGSGYAAGQILEPVGGVMIAIGVIGGFIFLLASANKGDAAPSPSTSSHSPSLTAKLHSAAGPASSRLTPGDAARTEKKTTESRGQSGAEFDQRDW